MADVHLEYVNSAFMRVHAEPSIMMEMGEHFTYFKQNYKFSPKFKAGIWDGKIRLLKGMTGLIYAGLTKKVKKFCDARGYTISWDDEFYFENVSVHEMKKFIKSLNIPEKFETRDYQFDSVLKCIRSKRRTLISPTSSGKTLMMYMISRWYENEKKLIIVPSVGLVRQAEDDFRDFGYEGKIHCSTDGLSKDNDIDAEIVVTTWQSLNNGKTKMPKKWYQQFGAVFGDEAHGAKATCLIEIMSNLTKCMYRFGTTGTLNNDELDNATIEGLFGPIYQATTTKELMDAGHVSQLLIKCLVLKYPEDVCKEFHKATYDPKKGSTRRKNYQEEVDFLKDFEKRNQFIKNLALSLDGNKLVFFRFIEQGEILNKIISEDAEGNVFHIDGSVGGKEREAIRKAIEDEENAVLIASLGTTSTGVSINKLHHMIAASPTKSNIKLLQSIGRLLRKHDSKDQAVIYDIVDDLSYKSYKNYTLGHFAERAKIYDSEKFDYRIYNLEL
tara:strand:+ start:1480 stop:2973 length:1494 start_codon:yes stop_codon:yes gene_type:complete